MEYLVVLLLGLCLGIVFARCWLVAELKYKAETKIDMCLNGKFYTVRRNLEREKNNRKKSKDAGKG